LSVTKNLINFFLARSRFWYSILASGAAERSGGGREVETKGKGRDERKGKQGLDHVVT
jgi:hypothetical protein